MTKANLLERTNGKSGSFARPRLSLSKISVREIFDKFTEMEPNTTDKFENKLVADTFDF
jgi:hypothetical protein